MTETSPEIKDQLAQILENQKALAERNDELAIENGKLKKQLDELASKGLPKDGVEAEEPVIPAESFKVNKSVFKFNLARFFVPGIGEVSATDALADKKKRKELAIDGKDLTITEWLVAKGSGVIDEVVA